MGIEIYRIYSDVGVDNSWLWFLENLPFGPCSMNPCLVVLDKTGTKAGGRSFLTVSLAAASLERPHVGVIVLPVAGVSKSNQPLEVAGGEDRLV